MARIGYSITLLYFSEAPAHYRDAIEYYEKRLSGLVHFTSAPVKRLPPSPDLVLFDPEGEEMTTDEFIAYVKKKGAGGTRVCFAVGPPEGFSREDKANFRKISLSKMTLQHDLARLVALEQIYRAVLTIGGVDYNK